MSLSDSHPLVGEVRDFDPKKFVANRKSLKVMSRDAQLGVAAAALACRDAGIVTGKVDPERFGVVFGADGICSPIEESETTYGVCLVDGQFAFERWGIEGMSASFPLGFLRVLPNMVASHVSIAQDARGPNNTIHEGEISSLLAVIEAASVIQRGMADVMLAGGASSQLHPLDFVRRLLLGRVSPRFEDPAAVVRPFDALRDGYVWSEGAQLSFWKAASTPSPVERRFLPVLRAGARPLNLPSRAAGCPVMACGGQFPPPWIMTRTRQTWGMSTGTG